MPVYVSYSYDGYVESIVLANSHSLATAYWQGAGIFPQHDQEYSEIDLRDHITGVIPLLATRKTRISKPGSYKSFEAVLVDK